MAKLLTLFALMFTSVFVFAQDAGLPVEDFISQVLVTIENFGGLNWVAKVAAVLAIVISSMKVSFLATYWEKLGQFKAYLAPVLAIAYGIFSLGVQSENDITWAGIAAYLTTGLGAIALHELLDTIKAIPGIGSVWVSVIDFIKLILRAPQK